MLTVAQLALAVLDALALVRNVIDLSFSGANEIRKNKRQPSFQKIGVAQQSRS